MSWQEVSDALLVLEDGRCFEGTSYGAWRSSVGELVFNTSMSGYQEILTDPSYAGQLVTMTTAHLGNYGVSPEDVESSRIWAHGLIVRSMSERASSWRSRQSLPEWLKGAGIPCIGNVDTRALTRHLRDRGVMKAMCAPGATLGDRDRLLEELRVAPAYGEEDWTVRAAVSGLMRARLSGGEVVWEALDREAMASQRKERERVWLCDFGAKHSIVRELLLRGVEVWVDAGVPSVEELRAAHVDGVMVSNGPGDPVRLGEASRALREVVEAGVPCYGICLGHQLVARSLGAETFKLRFGHRGPNQPVKELGTGRVSMTSQNHGYAVSGEGLPRGVEVTHVNVNDGTVAGFRHRDLPVMAVQYHPEAGPGPHDARDFFDVFCEDVRRQSSASWRG